MDSFEGVVVQKVHKGKLRWTIIMFFFFFWVYKEKKNKETKTNMKQKQHQQHPLLIVR